MNEIIAVNDEVAAEVAAELEVTDSLNEPWKPEVGVYMSEGDELVIMVTEPKPESEGRGVQLASNVEPIGQAAGQLQGVHEAEPIILLHVPAAQRLQFVAPVLLHDPAAQELHVAFEKAPIAAE